MQAAEGMHVEWVKGEAVVMEVASGQIHYLNAPAAVVYALILEHGFDEAMEVIEARFEPDSELRKTLPDLITQMTERGLLVA